ncbi:hypothetical protein KKA33_00135 [Patescibacteria group bacterium]|nr:hypothetical protein [Patescibacteria group bacterium]
MADENKNQNKVVDPEKIKQLENNLKNAYKEERFEDVKKLAAELKTIDPENHLAERLFEKVQEAEADVLKKANANQIKAWEIQIKQAFKMGNLPDIEQISAEVKKVDPENKVVCNIEDQIEKARAMLLREDNKGKIKVLEMEIKILMQTEKWNEVRTKAAELLDVDKGSRFALKSLKKADEAQPQIMTAEQRITSAPKKEPIQEAKKEPEVITPTPVVPAVTAPAPAAPPAPIELAVSQNSAPEIPKVVTHEELPKEEKPIPADIPASLKAEKKEKMVKKEEEKTEKPGFFAHLFSKKTEAKKDVLNPDKKLQEAPQKKEVDKETEVKKEPAKPDLEKIKKEKIESLEAELKHALKDKNESEVKRLMEEIRVMDLKNKAIVNAQIQLDKERADLEAEAKKEKINGLTKEVKEAVKNEDWKRAEEKANELLKTEAKNRVALKALKKAEEVKKAPEVKKEAVKKPGFFTRLFTKKGKAPEKSKEAKQEAEKKPVLVKAPEAKPMAAPVIKAPVAAPVSQSVPPVKPATPPAFTPPPKPIVTMPKKEEPASAPVIPQIKEIEKSEKPIAAPVSLAMAQKSESPKPDTETAKKTQGEKGNIFTKLFGEKEAAPNKELSGKSIIDTIVAKTEEGKRAEQKARKKPDLYADHFLRFSTVFLEFSVAFILISAGFFYAQNIDTENRALSLIGIEENNASRLHAAAQDFESLEKDEKKISKEIKEYQEGYKDKNKEVVQDIVSNRLDWPDLIKKLNEVTESVYEKNPLSQYVQYNNYAYDVERGELRVSATLSDPLGKNLTKLAEIEEAFRYYPKDKNDPNDEQAPYFYGLKDFTSFSKTYSKTTGRYISNFSLTLYTKPLDDGKKK